MGFLDSAKEKYGDYQTKVAALNETRGPKIATLLLVDYMGGYGGQDKSTGSLTLYQNQAEFKDMLSKRRSFTIDNKDIADVAVEGEVEVNRRVTVTRLLALGIFAFALKKKSTHKDAYITIVLADGQEAVFHTKGKSPMEMKVALAGFTLRVKQSTPEAVDQVPSGYGGASPS